MFGIGRASAVDPAGAGRVNAGVVAVCHGLEAAPILGLDIQPRPRVGVPVHLRERYLA